MRTAEGRYIPVDPEPVFVIGGGKESETVEKVKYIKIGQATKRRRMTLLTWPAQLNGWAVAWYAFLTVAGVLLYKLGAVYAMRERGYFAVGGEVLTLFLPILYHAAAATIRDFVQDMKDWW